MQAREDPGAAPALSIVAPCFDEEDGLPEFHRRAAAAARAVAGVDHEIVLVDDGSRDGTWGVIERAFGERPARRRRAPHAQPRPPARRHRRPRRVARPLRHADRRRPAGPARAGRRHDGVDGARRRRGLRQAHHARRRELVQEAFSRGVLPSALAPHQRADPRGHRRLPADEPARASTCSSPCPSSSASSAAW